MPRQIICIITLNHIINSPIFPINKYNTWNIILGSHITVGDERRKKLINKRSSAQDNRVGIDVIAEDRVGEQAVSVIFFSGIQAETFSGITAGRVSVDADSTFL